MFIRRRLYGHHCIGKHSCTQVKLFDPLLDSHGSQEHPAGGRVVQVAEQYISLCGLRQAAEVQSVVLLVVT